MIAIGVMKAAAKLEVAVRETDNAVFPRASNTSTLDTLPPGQQDTKIIPNAAEGRGANKKHKPKVSNGNTSN